MNLARRMADGSSLREHLLAEARATGKPDPALTAQVPPAGTVLWRAFTQLRGRGGGMSGGLTHGELAAWQQLHGVRLTAWEVDTLLAMDDACLEAAAAHAPAPPQTSAARTRS